MSSIVVSTRNKPAGGLQVRDFYSSCQTNPHAWTFISCPYFYTSFEEVASVRGRKNVDSVNPFEVLKYGTNAGEWNLRFCVNKYVGAWYGSEGINTMMHILTQQAQKDSAGLLPELCWAVDSTFDSQYNAMKAQLFAKANEPRFASAVFLFELGETLAYLKDLFKGLWAILKETYFRKKPGEFFKLSDLKKINPESLWLQYRYAIMPLILTISDVIKAFKGGRARQKVQHYSDNKYVFTHRQAVYPYYGRPMYFDVLSTYRVKTGGAIWVESQCDPAPFGTGFWDTLMGTWEVVRLSFVFDWLLDVGTWLASLRNTKLQVEKSYGTKVVDFEKVVSWGSDNPHYTLVEMGEPKVKGYKMIREVDISPPLLPALNQEMVKLYHQLDAIALIVGAVKTVFARRTK